MPKLTTGMPVLVRDYDHEPWSYDFFSHMDGDMYCCTGGFVLQCIPYRGNEHRVGTDSTPPNEWYPTPGETILVSNDPEGSVWRPAVYINNSNDRFVCLKCILASGSHIYDCYLHAKPLRPTFSLLDAGYPYDR